MKISSAFEVFIDRFGFLLPPTVAVIVVILVQHMAVLDDKTRTVVTVFTLIASMLFSLALTLKSHSDKSRQEILHAINFNFNNHYFRTSDEALQYVERKAPKCKLIMNTRLSSKEFAATRSLNSRIGTHDNAIAKAVARGCILWMVFEKTRAPEAKEFQEKIETAAKGAAAGQFAFYEIDCSDMPLLQLTVLHYQNGHRDALIGWPMGKRKEPSSPVILLRDRSSAERSPVDAFERLFQAYCEASRFIPDRTESKLAPSVPAQAKVGAQEKADSQ